MIPALDIYRAANLLIDRHGGDALIEAARMIDRMLSLATPRGGRSGEQRVTGDLTRATYAASSGSRSCCLICVTSLSNSSASRRSSLEISGAFRARATGGGVPRPACPHPRHRQIPVPVEPASQDLGIRRFVTRAGTRRDESALPRSSMHRSRRGL
jgi:hypothetical protein